MYTLYSSSCWTRHVITNYKRSFFLFKSRGSDGWMGMSRRPVYRSLYVLCYRYASVVRFILFKGAHCWPFVTNKCDRQYSCEPSSDVHSSVQIKPNISKQSVIRPELERLNSIRVCVSLREIPVQVLRALIMDEEICSYRKREHYQLGAVCRFNACN